MFSLSVFLQQPGSEENVKVNTVEQEIMNNGADNVMDTSSSRESSSQLHPHSFFASSVLHGSSTDLVSNLYLWHMDLFVFLTSLG